METLAASLEGKGYGALKDAVADAVIATLSPIRTEFTRLLSEKQYLTEQIRLGAERASASARKTVRKVYHKMGFDSVKA